MKTGLRNILILMLAAFCFVSQAAHAEKAIALTVTYKVLDASKSDAKELGLNKKKIHVYAKEALQKRGYKILPSYKDTLGGIELKIDTLVVQNVIGESNGYAVSMGIYVVANGYSSVKKVKRVAVTYGNMLSTGGGKGFASAEETRENVRKAINNAVAGIFVK